MPRLSTTVMLCAAALLLAAAAEAPAAPVDRFPTGAPPPRFRQLTSEHGLPMNDVRGIVRDAQGFMWFGTTQGGVSRYDGRGFRTYQHDPENPRTLVNNAVWTLLCDRTGALWVATNGGLDRYDPATDAFAHFLHRTDDASSLPHNNVLALFEDRGGTIWVGSRGGLSRFDAAGGRFTTYTREADRAYGANVNSVRCIAEDPATGLLWIGTSDGLCAFDRHSGQFASFFRRQRGTEPLNSINAILIDDDVLWVLTEVGLLKFQPRIREIPVRPPVEFPDFTVLWPNSGTGGRPGTDFLRSGWIDRKGRCWIGTKDGLLLFNRGTETAVTLARDPLDRDTLSDSFINRVYEDPDGHVWIGTRYGGVNRLRDDPFINFRPPGGTAADGGTGAVTSLHFSRDGRLWIGTPGGLHALGPDGWQRFRHDPGDPDSLNDNYITAIGEDRRGQLWVGTFNAGLSRFDGAKFTSYRRPEGATVDENAPVLTHTGDQVTSLLPTDDGGMWIGARVYGIDLHRDGNFLHFPATVAGRPVRPTDYASLSTIAPDGALWFGTFEHGLVRLALPAGGAAEFTAFLPRPDDPNDQLNKAINAVYDDGRGSLWVGNPGGLLRFDLATRKFTRHYTQRDGLTSDAVYSIVSDRTGRIWLGTQNGITRLDPANGEIHRFGPGDGLASAQMIIAAAERLPDGRLAFGSLAGVTLFDPAQVPTEAAPPPVVLTGFTVMGLPVEPGAADSPLRTAIQHAKEVRLGPGQPVFTFGFAALDFVAPESARYRYRMDGFDTDWRNTADDSRTATYTNLPPGDYTFRVQAATARGTWSDPGAAIRVSIAPPWWATWWARLAVVLGTVALVLGVFRWRLRIVARRNEELERQIAERRAAEAVIRASEERFRALYEDNPAMYVTLDAAGHVLSVNHFGASMLGYAAEELVGRPVLELFHPDDRAAAQREIATCLAQPGELVRLEARKVCKDGRILWVKELARSVRRADGTTVVLVVCEDITARVELETQLRQSQKMEAFGQLAGGVAHDFNNILSVILGQSQLAQDPSSTAAERMESLGDIKEAALRARNLTRQLLVFSRRQAMTPVTADLNQVVQNLARMLERLIGEPVALALDLAPEPAPVFADVAMLEQVLVNLAVNARDAMPSGGKLILRTRVGPPAGAPALVPPLPPDRVRLEVEDTGIGIPAEILPRIFEPFFTTKEVGKGTGLGLATSLGIVQQHRGTIAVESRPGAGSVFRIELPLHRIEPVLAAAARAAPALPGGGQETVLLVEDEAAVRSSARRILERAGYRVIEAVNGDDGLRAWEERRKEIDFVLTDVVMPGSIMGRELIARLREQHPALKYGFMSGYAADAGRNGAPAFEERAALLGKPFEIEALLRFVRARLGS